MDGRQMPTISETAPASSDYEAANGHDALHRHEAANGRTESHFPVTAERARSDADSSYFTAAQTARWMTLFLWVGLAARAIRYLLCFPLWEDECFLCINFVDRNFSQLLAALDHHQVAPPLFLWLELASVKLLGYSEWSLRLVPFLASIAALFLFRRLASLIFERTALVFAFGVFAVAYPGIRYAAEAKQYSTDLFASLVALTLVALWCQSGKGRYLWLLVALAPVFLWLSYPFAFVAGGVSLTIAMQLVLGSRGAGSSSAGAAAERLSFWALFRPSSLLGCYRANKASWWAWTGLNLSVLVGFASVYFVIKRQSASDLGFMSEYWSAAFPPLAQPWKLPAWFLVSHTSDIVAWPVGGGNGASAATGLMVMLGAGGLLWRRQWVTGSLLLAPAAINLLAAAIQRYPYGGHVKFSMYLGPAVCLLAGYGAAVWNVQARHKYPRFAWQGARATAALLIFVAGVTMARDIVQPYKTLSDQQARAFAEWFWFNTHLEGVSVVVDRYEGILFAPEASRELTWNVMFLCNEAIYGQPMKQQIPSEMADSVQRPTRCLVYRDKRFKFNDRALARWQQEMKKTYELNSLVTYPFTRFGKADGHLRSVDYLDIYTYTPQPAALKESRMAAGQKALERAVHRE